MAIHIRRREFIFTLGGAVAWPLAARAQQPPPKVRRIGVLTNLVSDDPESLTRIGAFLQGLEGLGWTDGRNVRIDYRWGAGDPTRNACRRINCARPSRYPGDRSPDSGAVDEG